MFYQIQKYDRSSEKRSEIEGELEDIQRSKCALDTSDPDFDNRDFQIFNGRRT